MARKVQKTLNLSVEVAEVLEEESNQSKVVEQLLKEKYDL
jgi:hypothetical protein